jgi:cyclopropane fatty-acyl-phospholipid synthase-like methyltransferase
MKNNNDLFAHKSKSWDMNSKRVKNANNIASLIVEKNRLSKDMSIMDFGAGTGLLSFFISPHVGKITALDNSPSMLEEFKNKSSEFLCETEILLKDLSAEVLEQNYAGIISSMTLHHIEDLQDIFSKFYSLLDKNGFLALADLDSEDGTFHSSNEGVFHFGFSRDDLKNIAEEVGFKNISFSTASTIEKEYGSFNIFLMTAIK